MKKNQGFTLIELMIAIMIFAIISIISYRIISSLLITKQVVTASQNKWGNLAQSINRLGVGINKAIPLVIRSSDGSPLPAVLGKEILENAFDAQLELSTSGNIGDPIYGTTPPKRIGFRFVKNTLYIVSWPVLNRVITSTPRVDILLENVHSFHVTFLYPDKQWRNTWPMDQIAISSLPPAIKIELEMKSGEQIIRQWALW